MGIHLGDPFRGSKTLHCLSAGLYSGWGECCPISSMLVPPCRCHSLKEEQAAPFLQGWWGYCSGVHAPNRYNLSHPKLLQTGFGNQDLFHTLCKSSEGFTKGIFSTPGNKWMFVAFSIGCYVWHRISMYLESDLKLPKSRNGKRRGADNVKTVF